MLKKSVCIIVLLGSALSLPVLAGSELADMDLEQLMNMNVSSVSKREQTFASAAAAIYTITQEDIRRRGATNLADALAQAPGIEVARISPAVWAITARGFNSQVANRLLVLIDGRTIYAPLFSGVYWDEQMPSLDDIKRIELIRGPGASLWGANAVNGVVNIVTYDSEQTQGVNIVAGMGNEERGFLRTRYGGQTGALTGRVNAQVRKVDAARTLDGSSAQDDYEVRQGGARLDWRPQVTDKITLDAGVTETRRQQFTLEALSIAEFSTPRSHFGANAGYLLGNWAHALDSGDGLIMQAYVDVDDRVDPLNTSKRLTADYELQYNEMATERQRWTWGLEYRYVKYLLEGSFAVDVSEKMLRSETITAFVQDEIRLTDTINATLGVKFENSHAAETEYQPSMRLAWQPQNDLTFWGSISRAIRIPSLFESRDVVEYRAGRDEPIPIYRVAEGNEDLPAEVLYAYETGVRIKLGANALFDATVFVNDYRRLYSPVLTGQIRIDDPVESYRGQVSQFDAVSDARGEGFELATDYMLGETFHFKSAYSYLRVEPHSENLTENTVLPTTAQRTKMQSPEHQLNLIFYHDLANQWQFDWGVRYVHDININGADVPSYTDLNMRLGKQLTQQLELALIGKNLADRSRLEFIDIYYGPAPTELERSVYLQITWR